MNAKELRIGNYVQGDTLSIPREEIFSDGIMCVTAYGIYLIDDGQIDFEPIPLTEDWLIKFGFTKKEKDGEYGYIYYIPICDYNYTVERDWNKYSSHFFGHEYTDCPNEKDDYIIHQISFDLRYVHQLQNIYFSLTERELKLC